MGMGMGNVRVRVLVNGIRATGSRVVSLDGEDYSGTLSASSHDWLHSE